MPRSSGPPGRDGDGGPPVVIPPGNRLRETQPATAVFTLTSGAPGADAGLDRAGWLALSHERDQWAARLDAEYRAGFDLGKQIGTGIGRRQVLAEEAAAWRRVAGKVARGAGDPSFAELERRRWGPGGRDHVGDPRPGDFPGTEGAGRA
jgi:hypothetical protein